jgi:phosphohistidine phosphatase
MTPMRRLLLLRHAKAVPLSREDDFDRVLTDSGRRDARRIGEWLLAHDRAPDLCVYSGAARTRETAEIVLRALPRRTEAIEANALYEATRFLILGLLRELDGGARSVLVVGHNPGMGEVANLLAGEGAAGDRLRLASKFPTAALAVLAFDRPDWSELVAGSGFLEKFVTPGDI